jgi:uncharacterized protein (UPF0548 family)
VGTVVSFRGIADRDEGNRVSRRTGTPPWREDSARRRLRQTATWGVGTAVTALQWLVVRVPMYRRDRTPESHELPDLDRQLPGEPGTVQRARDGVGPVFHRHYWIEVTDEQLGTEALIDHIVTNLNAVTPTRMSRFETIEGGTPHDDLCVGDELVVRLAGPWDGPVRVIDRTRTSFRLATLTGHMEAGEIEFRATRTERGWLRFEIESWASSASRQFHLLYDRVPIAREMQLHMWSQFCQRVAKVSGGVLMTNVCTATTRVRPPAARPVHTTAPVRQRTRQLLPQLADYGHNFHLDELPRSDDAPGWHVDDYCLGLPSEAPGDPTDDGPFATACGLLDRYAMADPRIVRAVFYADAQLPGRDMVLEGHFYGLRFPMGVRIGEVVDVRREIDGRAVRVRGWNYRTLADHLERGQMDWEIWKWLDSGDVEFRLHVVSQRAAIDNLVVRLGFWLFGRWTQVRFVRHVLARMDHMVASVCNVAPAQRSCVTATSTEGATVEARRP